MYDLNYRPCNLSEYLDNKIGVPIGKKPGRADVRRRPRNAVPVSAGRENRPRLRNWHFAGVFGLAPRVADQGHVLCAADTRYAYRFRAARSHPKEDAGTGADGLRDSKSYAHACQSETAFPTRMSRRRSRLCQQEIQKLLPQARVDEFALPFGVAPTNRALASEGQYQGIRYRHRAVMLVGAGPARSVLCRVNSKPTAYPRIQAADGASCSSVWLKQIETNHQLAMSATATPAITTIPKALEPKLDKSRLNGSDPANLLKHISRKDAKAQRRTRRAKTGLSGFPFEKGLGYLFLLPCIFASVGVFSGFSSLSLCLCVFA